MHEADEPNAVVDLLDAGPLAGQHSWDVYPLVQAESPAGGDERRQARQGDDEERSRHREGVEPTAGHPDPKAASAAATI